MIAIREGTSNDTNNNNNNDDNDNSFMSYFVLQIIFSFGVEFLAAFNVNELVCMCWRKKGAPNAITGHSMLSPVTNLLHHTSVIKCYDS